MNSLEPKLPAPLRSSETVAIRANRPTGIPMSTLYLQQQPGKVALRLSMIVILLAAVHTISLFLFYANPEGNAAKQVHRLFNLGVDGNVPTLFSACILLAAAALLYLLSRLASSQGNRYDQTRWLILSGIFIFLAVDEGAMIHDFMAETIRSRMPVAMPSFLYFSWIIPYFFFALGTGIFFIPFLWRLPVRTRNLMVLSGVLFVAGALGFEMFESAIVAGNNEAGIINEEVRPLSFYMLETFEEIIEMSAIVLFIYTLLDYIKIKNAAIEWRLI